MSDVVVETRARKGDIVAFELCRGYVTADYKRVSSTVWRFGVAEQCSRDGRVRKVRQVGYGTVLDLDRSRYNVGKVAVVPLSMLSDPAAAVAALPADDLPTIEDARAVIAPFKA